MYTYFGDCYPWDLAVVLNLGRGANISDLDRELRHLREIEDKTTPEAAARWSDAWCRLAEKILKRAAADAELGFGRTAALGLLHASRLLGVAAAGLPVSDPARRDLELRARECWSAGVALRGDPVEQWQIPYGDGALPALFRPADTSGAAPCVVTFNGLDTTKEWLYAEFAEDLARRGLRCWRSTLRARAKR